MNGMDEYADLYRIALTWTDGNEAAAKKLVEAYSRGCLDRAILEGRHGAAQRSFADSAAAQRN